ncbi:hypothetical protein Tco_0710436 [Tanacetum coccineum]
MEITTTMGMGGTMGVPTRDFRHAALRSMTEREARGREATIGMTWNDFKALLVEEFCPSDEMESTHQEITDIQQKDKNEVKRTNSSTRMERVQEIEAEGTIVTNQIFGAAAGRVYDFREVCEVSAVKIIPVKKVMSIPHNNMGDRLLGTPCSTNIMVPPPGGKTYGQAPPFDEEFYANRLSMDEAGLLPPIPIHAIGYWT